MINSLWSYKLRTIRYHIRSLPPDLRCITISKPPKPLDPEQATPWVIFAMGRASKRSLAGRKNQKKAAEENIFDRVYSYGSAEGKCYLQALTREVSRVDEMMEEMREYNEKTKHNEKLANKSKQDTKKSCALFKVTVHPTRLHVVLWHCCPDCTQQ